MDFKWHPADRSDAYGTADFAGVKYEDTGAADSGVFFGQLKTRPSEWTRMRRFGIHPKRKTVPGDLGPLIYSTPESNVLICAPAGAGKGAAVIIPTLLRYQGSVLTIDPKGENAAVTARQRKKMGSTVHIVNPWNLHADRFAKLGFQSSRFNPLDILDPADPNIVSTANFITDLCVVPTQGAGQHHESYWDESAKQLILGLLLYIVDQYPPEQRSLALLRRLVTQSYDDLGKTFAHMASLTSFSGALQEAGNQFIGMDPRPLSSIVSTAQTNTKFLTDPVIKESLSASDFSFADLKTTPTTIYVIIPSYELETQSRWLRLMVGMAATAMERSAPGPGHRCLFLLDEFAALGPLKKIQSGIATMRGYGVDMVVVLQDLGQLRHVYPNGADTILANCRYKHFMRVSDKTTADYVSALLGNETVTVQSGNLSHSNFADTGRPLSTPDELMGANPETGYLLKSGSRPILLRQMRYFDERKLAKHADPNPMHLAGW